MLSWDRETTTYAPNDATGQPEWQRKEKLYKEVSAHAISETLRSHKE